MTNIPIDIVIPIYNEGENVIKLLNHFQEIIKTRFRVLLCYDLDADNVFNYKDEIKKLNFETLFVKNPLKGPCAAIKEGGILSDA